MYLDPSFQNFLDHASDHIPMQVLQVAFGLGENPKREAALRDVFWTTSDHTFWQPIPSWSDRAALLDSSINPSYWRAWWICYPMSSLTSLYYTAVLSSSLSVVTFPRKVARPGSLWMLTCSTRGSPRGQQFHLVPLFCFCSWVTIALFPELFSPPILTLNSPPVPGWITTSLASLGIVCSKWPWGACCSASGPRGCNNYTPAVTILSQINIHGTCSTITFSITTTVSNLLDMWGLVILLQQCMHFFTIGVNLIITGLSWKPSVMLCTHNRCITHYWARGAGYKSPQGYSNHNISLHL